MSGKEQRVKVGFKLDVGILMDPHPTEQFRLLNYHAIAPIPILMINVSFLDIQPRFTA